MTLDERAALTTLCKLAIVTQIAIRPKDRDPEYRAIIENFGLDGIDALIEQLNKDHDNG